MRPPRRILMFVSATSLFVGLSPSVASAATLTFTHSPVGGPPGTDISISGNCPNANNGFASLQFPVRSDALAPPIDSTSFEVGPNGNFFASLTNDISTSLQFPPEDPIDLEVVVTCGFSSFQTKREPFASTSKTTNSSSTVFTSLGSGACGFGFVPADSDTTIPCRAHVKGLGATGAINDTNFYVDDWMWGSSIAVGAVDDDLSLDIVSGSGPRPASAVNVADLNGQSLLSVSPFGAFAGGVSVAVGDVNGDGNDDIVAGAGPGGGPHVRVFTIVGGDAIAELASFYAYDPGFSGGVSVAAADFTGDGKAEIITGTGAGGSPHVRTFSATGSPLGGFYAYAPNFPGGVNVAAANLLGDGNAEIVTGPGPGGGPHIRVFNAGGTPIGAGFYAYAPDFAGGAMVAVGDANNSGGNEIVTGPQTSGDPHIRVFDANGAGDGGFYAYTRGPAGTRVAVAP